MDDSVCGPGGKGKGKGDLAALQPTVLAGVPAVWEKIKGGIEKELDKQNFLIRSAFYGKNQEKKEK
jgi:long-chain acyl-CoA synthetase